MPRPVWIRLSVDVDSAMNVLGSSYEVRQKGGEDGPSTFTVMPMPGPFDTPEEALAALIARCHTQLVLFP